MCVWSQTTGGPDLKTNRHMRAYSIRMDTALLAQAKLTAQALGFRGLNEIILILLSKWLLWVKSQPGLVADVARWEDFITFYGHTTDQAVPPAKAQVEVITDVEEAAPSYREDDEG